MNASAATGPDSGASAGAAAPAAGRLDVVRGERLLSRLGRLFLWGDRALGALPARHNPLAQTGAITNFTLLVAVVSGILLLFWYTPSVQGAYESVRAMDSSRFGAGLVRTLHRYSSDACIFFALLHALRLFLDRRFTRSRWIAWLSGLFMVGVLWFVGWLGYWLVWDERAQLVAVGTARLIDALPLFSDPMPREFLTDGSVRSLTFFLVFFMHMLLPLAMGIGLWLHLSRTRRSEYLTGWSLSAWILVSLLLLSLVWPADTATQAQMQVTPRAFTMDGWYLWPVLLTERLGTGALWSLLLFGGALLYTLPWTLTRRRPAPARVETSRCHGCRQCFEDCPVGAVRMVAPAAGMKAGEQASVEAARCVSCGICAGSCKSAAIDVLPLATLAVRDDLDAWLATAEREGTPLSLAYVCAQSAGSALKTDAGGRVAELPGYRVVRVPCIGWVQMTSIERALHRGAARVLLVSCPPESCHFREGVRWTEQRLAGEREPGFREQRFDAARVQLVALGAGREGQLFAAALGPVARPPRRGQKLRWLVTSLAATIVLSAVVAGANLLPYSTPTSPEPRLVVSFKHPGATDTACRPISAEEQAKQPAHMRRAETCERSRNPVRLRIWVDGRVLSERAYEPQGLWKDGNSVAIEEFPLAVGRHRVKVELGDTAAADAWPHSEERELELRPFERRVVLFEKKRGIQWH